ncbi:MAG: hypothetical protein SFV53_05785, partial [Rickettsiales bacterium]|nr:hypothetical protein [Rickettsiales bacterium]
YGPHPLASAEIIQENVTSIESNRILDPSQLRSSPANNRSSTQFVRSGSNLPPINERESIIDSSSSQSRDGSPQRIATTPNIQQELRETSIKSDILSQSIRLNNDGSSPNGSSITDDDDEEPDQFSLNTIKTKVQKEESGHKVEEEPEFIHQQVRDKLRKAQQPQKNQTEETFGDEDDYATGVYNRNKQGDNIIDTEQANKILSDSGVQSGRSSNEAGDPEKLFSAYRGLGSSRSSQEKNPLYAPRLSIKERSSVLSPNNSPRAGETYKKQVTDSSIILPEVQNDLTEKPSEERVKVSDRPERNNDLRQTPNNRRILEMTPQDFSVVVNKVEAELNKRQSERLNPDEVETKPIGAIFSGTSTPNPSQLRERVGSPLRGTPQARRTDSEEKPSASPKLPASGLEIVNLSNTNNERQI